MRKFLPQTTISLAIAALLSPFASAQTESGRSGAAAALMEEVMVTARRKAVTEDVQDVPLAVSAFSGDQIEAMFAADLFDITATVPNASATENGSFPNYVNFFVRGMGVAGTVISDDPTVGVFVDGVYMGVSAGVLLDSFDLESVEILRGPQGTLFGRNVTGGAALVRTRRPTEELTSRFRASYGNDERVNVSASVSGPIVEDRVLGKIAFMYKSNDDWLNNPSGNALGFDDIGEREQLVLRGAFSFIGNESFTADLRFEIGDSEDDPLPIAALDNTALLGAQPIPGISELAFEEGDDPIANGVLRDPAETDWASASLELNWDLGRGTLKSVTAWRDYEQDGLSQDFDGSVVQLFDVNNSFIEQDQFSQELLYNVDVSDSVSLTAGAYYFNQDWEYGERRFGILFAPFGTGVDPVLGAPVGGLQTHSVGDHEVFGLFAQADIAFNDNWVLTLGGRFSSEEKDVDIGQFGNGLIDGTFTCTDLVGTDPRNCPFNFSDSEDWSNFTPKIGIQYRVNENTQAYASYSKGFRSGGFNVRQNIGVVPGPYDEETVDAFEIGLKTDLADGRVRINAAAFLNEFDDLQRTVVNQDGFQSVSNAANADISGVELELSLLPVDNFLLQFIAGYLDTEIKDFVNPRGGPDGSPLIVDGTQLPFTPEWQTNINATYDIDLGSGSLTLRASHQFFDDTQSTDDNLGFPSDSYEVLNASVSYAPDGASWRVTAFGRNLTDEIRGEQITSAINPGWILQTGRQPLNYGVELSVEF